MDCHGLREKAFECDRESAKEARSIAHNAVVVAEAGKQKRQVTDCSFGFHAAHRMSPRRISGMHRRPPFTVLLRSEQETLSAKSNIQQYLTSKVPHTAFRRRLSLELTESLTSCLARSGPRDNPAMSDSSSPALLSYWFHLTGRRKVIRDSPSIVWIIRSRGPSHLPRNCNSGCRLRLTVMRADYLLRGSWRTGRSSVIPSLATAIFFDFR